MNEGLDKPVGPPRPLTKEELFFVTARMDLPLDAFHEFLKLMKKLANDAITKKECLAEANLLFGDTYHHLYLGLIQMLEEYK